MKTGRPKQGVFISYARADGESVARALQARLKADAPDIDAWLDRSEIEGGLGWWSQIEAALDRAEFLILVMTPAAMHSDNARREWRGARQRGVCVYPVMASASDELGFAGLPAWMAKAHFYDPQLEWPKLVAHLRRGCTATRVPFMAPPLPASFVGRAQQQEIVDALLQSRTAAEKLVALRGAGGFGKTTQASAICHDERIIDGFDDGILWVTLGQTPNLLIELVKLYAALTGERPGFVDVEDGARELALKLENRNCLLVVDDAWNAAHVRPFLMGGSGCARLITTRLHDLTDGMSRIEIEQMSPAEALALLVSRAGVTLQDVAPFRAVTERLGDWPLVIKLAGSAMRQRIERGDSPEHALDYVRRALDKRGITAFDTEDPSDRSGAVGRTVGAGLDLLDESDRVRCMELAIFPQNSTIALGTAARVWQLDDLDSEDLARKLDDLALIDFDLQGDRLRMHDVLRSYLQRLLPDPPAVHTRLLGAWGDPYRLPDVDAWRGFAFHMVHAGRRDAFRALLLDVRWLDARLRATDIGALIGDFDFLAGDASTDLVRDALRLSAPAIAEDPGQLRTQLLGRLLSRREPDLVSMLERSTQVAEGPWLRLLHASLDAPGGMLIMTLVGHTREVTALAMDAACRTLISGSEDGTVRVWDLRHGRLLRTFEHRRLGVRAVATTTDGGIVLSAGADGLLYLWDTARGACIARFLGSGRRARRAVALSADGAVAVSGSREPHVTAYDLRPLLTSSSTVTESPEPILRSLSGHSDSVTSVALAADGRVAVSGSDDGTVRVWDVESGALRRTAVDGGGAVNAVALSADGAVALSGSENRTIKVWNIEDGTCLRTLSGHERSVTSLAVSHRRVLSGSSDQRACLWSLDTGALLARLDGHSDAVTAVAIDSTGTVGATASIDRTIKVWGFHDIRAADASDTHAGAVASLLFSDDGCMCASGGDDGRIKIRDVASGRVLRTIDTKTAPVRSLAFTADGSCVLGAGLDDQARLWVVEDGRSTWIPVRHFAPIDDSTLSPVARYMVTACSDRFVYLWDVPSGGLIEKYSTRRLFDHLIEPSPRRREHAGSEDSLDEYLPGEPIFQVRVARISNDGSRIILTGFVPDAGVIHNLPRQVASGGVLLVFDPRSRAVNTVPAAHADQVSAVAVDAAATRLLWARADHQLELWDLQAEERMATLRGHRERVNAVAFTPEGTHAISCSRDRSVRVWDLATGECVALFIADAALRSLAVAPDGSFAIGDVAGRVHFLRLAT